MTEVNQSNGGGQVGNGAKDTNGSMDHGVLEKYTNTEWQDIFARTEQSIKVSKTPYPVPQIGSRDFMKTIDHTLLKLEAKTPQFDDLCAEARRDDFATVCVRPQYISQCLADLKGSDVKVDTVIGFHEGTYDLSHKLKEVQQSLSAGASELDLVLNYPHLQQGSYTTIYNELASIRSSAPQPTTLKLIFETSQLTDSQIIAACVLSAAANFDFVKTSTGFNGHGATEHHVRLMKACCEYLAHSFGSGRREMLVKASGGIRTLADAVKMLEAGASRLGTSAGVWIAKEAREKTKNGDVEAEDVREERPGLTTRLFTDY